MRILLDIKVNKSIHILEDMKGLPHIKAKVISNEKALLMEEIKVSNKLRDFREK